MVESKHRNTDTILLVVFRQILVPALSKLKMTTKRGR
jgi:hypothetical protein